ncbi:MAG: class I tRNA ligase family protein, partial [Planctomycetota bacterium]
VMPVWHCVGCDDYRVFGSVAELEKASNQKISDLHKHIVDEVVVPCKKCNIDTHRIPDVLDTWFDSGSMPYAQVHYPFENEEKFDASFPAQFIAEGQDQTRAWFYYLHVIASGIRQSRAFTNVIVNGIVLAEDGKKMSKKLQNYPDPNKVLNAYGADALRYFLVTSPVMHAESLNFSEDGVREMYNKLVNTLWNVFTFYQMFAKEEIRNSKFEIGEMHVLDKWILARLNQLVKEVTIRMDAYELSEASRPIMGFVLDLSQWHVRRSRDRFKGEDEADKQAALATLREVLLTLSKVMAPFTPFIAEKIYRQLTTNNEQRTSPESVHLEMWPEVDEKMIDDNVIHDMEQVRKIVEMGHSLRKEAGIPVRQPLPQFSIFNFQFSEELLGIISDELNVKSVVSVEDVEVVQDVLVKEGGDLKVGLNTELTDELRKEGLVREIVRAVNQKRKEQGFTRHDQVIVEYSTEDDFLNQVFAEYSEELKKLVLAHEIKEGDGQEVDIDGRLVYLTVEKQ